MLLMCASHLSALTRMNSRFRSSKVRLAVLQCLQSMAKSDSKALHSLWTSILPVQQPLQPRPLSPNLVTVLLFDPVPKVMRMLHP